MTVHSEQKRVVALPELLMPDHSVITWVVENLPDATVDWSV